MTVVQTPADSIREAAARVFTDPQYDWTTRRHSLHWLQDWWNGFLVWLDGLESAHPGAYYALLGLLSGLLIAILIHFGVLIWRALRPRAPTTRPGVAALASDARSPDWHVRVARRLAGEGRYADALAHRFAALVLELDRRGTVAFRPSKTPAEYQREVELDEGGRRTFADAVLTLYRHVFGGEPCGSDDLQRFVTLADRVLDGHAT